MKFLLGANYWASHAGVYMWRNWDADVVETDLELLSKCGIGVLRAFPLWTDFQPLTRLNGANSYEIRHGDQSLDKQTPEGLAGVDIEMIRHFEEFVLLAKKYNIQLIIPLINGWMSSRMFFPPAFEDRNPISDYETIKWEVRFVKYFVNYFKGFDNIIAWECGNESNVMGFSDKDWDRGVFGVWMSLINNTIRSVDPTRPVIAGLHGLSLHSSGVTIADVGELCDVLTVHPYAAFVPHCDVDGYETMKSMLHATSEAKFYSDISGKPCLCEEIGTLGSSYCCEELASEYLRANLYSLWAHGFAGVLWWCAFDQDHLKFPPYDWNPLERDLGIFRNDGSQKLMCKEIVDFREFLSSQKPLTPYQTDAVCILSKDQDDWAVAYSVNLLCKQAGLDVQFVDGENVLPKASIYLLPCLSGETIPTRTWTTLMNYVKNGATLYISWNDSCICNFEDTTGMKVVGRSKRGDQNVLVTVPSMDLEMPLRSERRLALAAYHDAQILGTESDGNPVLTYHAYGKGGVYFLAIPMETALADQSLAFEGTNYYRLYQQLFGKLVDRKITYKSSPKLAITEHPIDDSNCTIVALNYGEEKEFLLKIKQGWSLDRVEYGQVTQLPTGDISVAPEAKCICRFTLRRI